jgi:hypothetical protein
VRVKSEEVLERFRGPGRCELCGRPCRVREVHHIRSRGAHGADHRWNCLSVCPTGSGGCDAHHRIHFGGLTQRGRRMTRIDLFEIVSRREGVPVADIIAELNRLRDLPADAGERRPRSKLKRHSRCQLPGCHRSTQGKGFAIGGVSYCPGCFWKRVRAKR